MTANKIVGFVGSVPAPCGYYHERGHFDEYVARYNPDLVVIGGTSNYRGREKGETLDMAEEWLVETIELMTDPGIKFHDDGTATVNTTEFKSPILH